MTPHAPPLHHPARPHARLRGRAPGPGRRLRAVADQIRADRHRPHRPAGLDPSAHPRPGGPAMRRMIPDPLRHRLLGWMASMAVVFVLFTLLSAAVAS